MPRKYGSILEYFKVNYESKLKTHMLEYFKDENLYASKEEYDNPSEYQFKIDTNVNIEKLCFFQTPGYYLDFDMVIACDTTVTSLVGDELETNEFYEYFVLKLNGLLFNGFHQLTIEEIKKGRAHRPFENGKSMNEFLVPYIKKEQYDDFASDFLSLNYPDALKKAVFTPPPVIMSKLNLEVKFGPLPKKCFGKTIFASEEVEIWNFDTKSLQTITAKPGTIIINYEIMADKGFGGLNFVAIHECVHWYLHRKYFELMKVLNPGLTSLCCEEDVLNNTSNAEFKNKYFMEKQADAITARILMPTKTAKPFFEATLKVVKSKYHLKKEALFKKAVSIFADHFGASVSAAKYRLRDLGYTQMDSLIGEEQEKLYSSSVTLKPGETYNIEREALAKLMSEDETFKKWILSGVLVYADKKVVINSPEYVKRYSKKFGLKLTAKALRDVSQCCVLFNIKRQAESITYNPEVFNKLTFCSGGYQAHNVERTSLDLSTDHNSEILKLAKTSPATSNLTEAQAFVTELKSKSTISEKLDTVITHVIVSEGLSERQIAKRAMIGATSVSEYRDGTRKPPAKTLFALCGALRLHPLVTRHLFQTCHYVIEYDPELKDPYDLYCYLSQTEYCSGLDAWNATIRDRFPNDMEAPLP